jgi:hypothetical protein
LKAKATGRLGLAGPVLMLVDQAARNASEFVIVREGFQ